MSLWPLWKRNGQAGSIPVRQQPRLRAVTVSRQLLGNLAQQQVESVPFVL